MDAASSSSVAHPHVLRRTVTLALMLWASASFASPVDSRILFARDAPVPRPVQDFAWRVVEARCNYQPFEREQRSFWAYQTQARRIGERVVYSINIVSDLMWKRSDPPAIIQMTIVEDGGMRVAALKSSFVVCAVPPS